MTLKKQVIVIVSGLVIIIRFLGIYRTKFHQKQPIRILNMIIISIYTLCIIGILTQIFSTVDNALNIFVDMPINLTDSLFLIEVESNLCSPSSLLDLLQNIFSLVEAVSNESINRT